MFVGIDNGGTSTRVGAFESLRKPTFELLGRFATKDTYQDQLESITETLRTNGIRKCKGMGVSIGAQVSKDGQSVAGSVNLRDYVARPFAKDLTSRFGGTVRLAHDAVCGLLAEKKFGDIREYDRCAYLTVSTGTGAAIQLSKGPNSLTSSIEMGHQIIGGNTLVCLCGQTGCLETITGGKQIEMRFGKSAEFITDVDFWTTFSKTLAIGLVNLAQVTRIDAVTISGGIALNSVQLRDSLARDVEEILRGAELSLSWAAFGEDAPLVGAAVLLEVANDTILH